MLKGKSRARNVTLMTTAYFQEIKEMARKTLSATTTPQSNLQSSLIQGGLANNPNVGIQQKQDIFGYRFETFKDCMIIDPVEVSFGKEEQKTTITTITITIIMILMLLDDSNESTSEIPNSSNTKEVLDKEDSVKAMIDELPANSIKVTKRLL